jgi:ABC-type transport system involved in multi-copper enzyme maturation permease subunit
MAMTGSVWRCVRAEARRLIRQTFPYVGILGVLVATAVTAHNECREESALATSGFEKFAEAARTGFSFGGFFLVLLGVLSLSAEMSAGTLRALLLRPVRRLDILVAKAIVLAIVAVIVALAVVVLAKFWVGSAHGFLDVVWKPSPDLPDKVMISARELSGFSTRLLLVSVPALIACPLVGILIATLIETTGAAVATSAVVGLVLKILVGSNDVLSTMGAVRSWQELVFATYLELPVFWLSQLGRGIETQRTAVEGLGALSAPVLVPLASAVLILVAAAAILERKDVTQ